MLERLIDWSARNRLLVGVLTLMVAVGGAWATLNTPVDAIPDLSDVQVIVRTDFAGQGPQIVEEQVTYPLTSALLSVPKAQTVRGYSMFGTSFVYVIFEDGTDLYWARSRVLEYLNYVSDQLPEGVRPALGPDATGVGWVFQYALVDESGRHSLADLRSFQDWYLRYWLAAVPGVAEVASIGGFVKQYQVNLDPNALAAYDLAVKDVVRAIQASNNEVEGRLLEFAGREYMVRGRGYLRSVEDIEQRLMGSSQGEVPSRVIGAATDNGAGGLSITVTPHIVPGADKVLHTVRTRAGDGATAILRELEDRYRVDQADATEVAAVYAGLGNRDQAFVWLDKAFTDRSSLLADLRAEHPFAVLRDDPRYKDLLKRMNLPE